MTTVKRLYLVCLLAVSVAAEAPFPPHNGGAYQSGLFNGHNFQNSGGFANKQVKIVYVPVPKPVYIPVQRLVTVPVKEQVPIIIRKPYPVNINRPVPVAYAVPVEVKVPYPVPVPQSASNGNNFHGSAGTTSHLISGFNPTTNSHLDNFRDVEEGANVPNFGGNSGPQENSYRGSGDRTFSFPETDGYSYPVPSNKF